jgi:excisionase family DNA binding protein
MMKKSFSKHTELQRTELQRIEVALNKINLTGKNVLTLSEACEYTGFSKSTMYKLVANEAIFFSKPNGKMLFFDRQKLEAWLLSNGSYSESQLVFNSSRK